MLIARQTSDIDFSKVFASQDSEPDLAAAASRAQQPDTDMDYGHYIEGHQYDSNPDPAETENDNVKRQRREGQDDVSEAVQAQPEKRPSELGGSMERTMSNIAREGGPLEPFNDPHYMRLDGSKNSEDCESAEPSSKGSGSAKTQQYGGPKVSRQDSLETAVQKLADDDDAPYEGDSVSAFC